jgi:AcrR family transcriptional regulator
MLSVVSCAARRAVPLEPRIDTSTSSEPERVRPMRADALRNRAALMDAARAVFRRDGLAAQMDAIAETAGLGVGTLYRHFPTKEALIAVLVQERLERLSASAEVAVRADDPWEGLAGLVWALATFEAEDQGMVDILTDSAAAQPPDVGAAMRTFVERLGVAVTRAQAAGQMRTDVSADDVLIAVCGIGKMMSLGAEDGAGRWRRLVQVVLDGLRGGARAASPLG